MLTDRQFRRLSRADLIEVIYQLQADEDELRAENGRLRAELEDRRLKQASAGSIAEASLALSGVFEAAQAAADAYLAEIRTRAETLREAEGEGRADALGASSRVETSPTADSVS